MKSHTYSIFISLFLFSTPPILAIGQQVQVSGAVVSATDSQPLPGASVLLKDAGGGSSSGIATDAQGRFQLTAQAGSVLVVSSIGYQTQEIPLNGRSQVHILLEPDAGQLAEVVVVGYGTRERRELTGSISKVDPSETRDIAVGSIDAQLQGKVPGVQISSPTGVPGETSNIRIRGATTINASNGPLYVLDGVFVNSNSLQTISTGGKASSPLADINPDDIESVEVLKDAAATALFGSRGANGVILITTKRGGYDQRPKINFSTSHGWSEPIRLWELTTGPEHAELVNDWWVNTGKDDPSLNRTFENRPYRPVSEGGSGLPEEQQTYDRLGEIFRTGQVHNYDLSLSGGGKNTRYYIGAGYTDQESIIQPVTFDRAAFKLNLDQKISDHLSVGISNTFSRTYRNQARAGDGPSGGLLQAALHSPTNASPYSDDGELVGRAGFDNVTLLIQNYDVNSTSLRYIGNIYMEGELLPGLHFRSSFGIDYNNYDESEYWNTFLTPGSQGGLATSSLTQNTSWVNEQTLSYKKTVGDKHTFGFLLGNTLMSDVRRGTYAEGRGFANNDYKSISSAASSTSSQNWSKNTLASFFSRIDYGFDNKYLIDLSVRADGSSRFGADNKWAYFPAVGAAWRIKEEAFLQNSRLVNDLKLRVSYGITGNQNGIENFAALGLWGGNASYEGTPGTAPAQLGNQNLKWERTRQVNIGLDLSLFRDRLQLEANYYDKYTTNGLLLTRLAGSTGFSSYWNNAAEISNKGFELAINSVNIDKKDFTWTSSFNISRNVNKIEKLGDPLRYGSRDLILQQEGHPLYSFWLYEQLHVDPQTGNAVYRDVNNDGEITTSDRHIVGDIWPDFFGGFTNNFTYKNFDLNAFFAFQYGNKIYNHNAFFGGSVGARNVSRVNFKENLKRWQRPGDITDVPRPDGININNYRDGTSRFLEDGSFVRLRALSLGYTFPAPAAARLHMESLRLFFTGTNLFLLTNYSGADPESNSNADQNSQGIDLGTPPQPRTLQFGIDITL